MLHPLSPVLHDVGHVTPDLIACLPCSYVEEANADQAIKALTSALAPKAKALRDGEVKQIDASGLVPGAPPLPFPLSLRAVRLFTQKETSPI